MPDAVKEEARRLEMPATWSPRSRRAFLAFASEIEAHGSPDCEKALAAKRAGLALADPSLAAALHVLTDLARQGWTVARRGRSSVAVAAPSTAENPDDEK